MTSERLEGYVCRILAFILLLNWITLFDCWEAFVFRDLCNLMSLVGIRIILTHIACNQVFHTYCLLEKLSTVRSQQIIQAIRENHNFLECWRIIILVRDSKLNRSSERVRWHLIALFTNKKTFKPFFSYPQLVLNAFFTPADFMCKVWLFYSRLCRLFLWLQCQGTFHNQQMFRNRWPQQWKNSNCP